VLEQIQAVLADLEPYIQSHGGKIELKEFKNNTVFIKFHGTCTTCPLSFYTVTYGIERHLKSKISDSLSVQVLE
jgi:Fe-S cluster biogenesis protein NfuA